MNASGAPSRAHAPASRSAARLLLRYASARRYPFWASWRAIESPMPPVAPVIRAVLLFRFIDYARGFAGRRRRQGMNDRYARRDAKLFLEAPPDVLRDNRREAARRDDSDLHPFRTLLRELIAQDMRVKKIHREFELEIMEPL